MAIVCLCVMLSSGEPSNINMQIDRTLTIDSLGACQGVSHQKGKCVYDEYWLVVGA